MKEFAKDFYHSKAWGKTREAYMASKNYLCEKCKHPALIVHHKIHLTPQNINDYDITLNFDNLEAVCLECHNEEHGLFVKTAYEDYDYIIDKNGNIVAKS